MFGSSRSSVASHTGTRGGVVVDGVDLVVSDFMREAVEVRPRAERVVVHHADKAAQRMRNRVPIGPPTLHVLNSITSDQHATTDGIRVWADAGPDPTADEGAFVARFLEHGTVHQPPQPFVGPSGDETLPEFVDDIRGLPKL